MTAKEATAEAERRVRNGTAEVKVDLPQYATQLDDPAASGWAVRCWVYVMDEEA